MDTKKYDELTSSLNVVRQHYQGQEFTTKEIIEKIKFLGVNKNYMGILVANGIVNRQSRGIYVFPANPIYWNYVKKTLEAIKELQHRYNAKYIEKKHKSTSVEPTNIFKQFIQDNSISLDEIAQYLVSTGNYKIEKKTVTWEQL